MRIRKIGLISLMVILVIFLPLFVPGLAEMEIGISRKIGIWQN